MAGAAGAQAVRAETVCTTECGRRRKAHCGEQLEHVSLHRVGSLSLVGAITSSNMGYEPTPEQIAKAEEKRLKRLEKKLKQSKPTDETGPLFLARPWIPLQPPDQLHTRTVRVMTWNVRHTSLCIHLAAIRSKYTLVVARSVSRSCVESMSIFTIKSR